MVVKISVANLKGGTGKTATSALIATSLARRNNRVCLFDLDPQAHLTSVFLKSHPKENIVHLLRDRKFPYTEPELVGDGIRDKISIIPSSASFFADVFLRARGGGLGEHDPDVIRKFVDQENSVRGYDYLIYDCPPDPYFARYGMEISDYVLVPTTLSEMDRLGTVFFVTQVLKDYYSLGNEGSRVLGVLFSNVDKKASRQRSDARGALLKSIKDAYKDSVLRERIYVEPMFHEYIPYTREVKKSTLYKTRKKKNWIDKAETRLRRYLREIVKEIRERVDNFEGMGI